MSILDILGDDNLRQLRTSWHIFSFLFVIEYHPGHSCREVIFGYFVSSFILKRLRTSLKNLEYIIHSLTPYLYKIRYQN